MEREWDEPGRPRIERLHLHNDNDLGKDILQAFKASTWSEVAVQTDGENSDNRLSCIMFILDCLTVIVGYVEQCEGNAPEVSMSVMHVQSC